MTKKKWFSLRFLCSHCGNSLSPIHQLLTVHVLMYMFDSRCVQKKVVVAAPKKQRVLLRFLWLEKNIGIAIDQVVPGHGTIPLSPYFFWPRKDAWEQLKAKLDSKGWISRKRTIILLNQATDIINLWQENAANL